MGVVVEVGVVVVRWQWRWRPIHLSSSSLRLSHSSSCTSKMRDESDAIASGSSADTSTSRCGSRIGRSSEASKASGSSWGRGGAGVRRRCRESRRAGVAVVEAHLRSVGGTQSHRSAPRRRRAAACAVERNGARLAQRPSHHLRRRAGGGEPSKWQSGGDAAAALAPAALASSVARTGARPEGRPSGRIGCALVPIRCECELICEKVRLGAPTHCNVGGVGFPSDEETRAAHVRALYVSTLALILAPDPSPPPWSPPCASSASLAPRPPRSLLYPRSARLYEAWHRT